MSDKPETGGTARNLAEWPEEWADANEEAFLALSGARADIAGILSRLLRSSAPIDPIVRNALADAIIGNVPSGNPSFEVVGLGQAPRAPAGLTRFQLHTAIAEFVADRRAAGVSRAAAEWEAAAHFSVGAELCHKAVSGYAATQAWIEEHSLVAAGRSMPDDLRKRLMQTQYLFRVGPLVKSRSDKPAG